MTTRKLPEGEAAFRAVLRSYRRNAAVKGHVVALTDGEFRHLFGLPCYYCGVLPSGVGKETKGGVKVGAFRYSGVDRLDSSKGYVAGNVVPCCFQCNRAKMDLSATEFLAWARRLFEYSVIQQTQRIGVPT